MQWRYGCGSIYPCPSTLENRYQLWPEAPCERCLQKGRECIYPERKPKLVSVSENYISELERNAGRAQTSESSSRRTASASNTNTGLVFEIMLPESGIALKNARLFSESSTERFVRQLKELAFSEISTSNRATSSMDYTSLHGKYDDMCTQYFQSKSKCLYADTQY